MTRNVARSYVTRSAVRAALVYAVLILVAAASLFPFAFTGLTSIKQPVDLYKPLELTFRPTAQNYVHLFASDNFLHYLVNSTIVTAGAVIVPLTLALFAAYGLARLRLRRGRAIALLMLSLRTVPAIAVVLPYFLMTRYVGLFDTYWILIITYTTFNLPLAVWLLRGFMLELPMELNEAAQVDGAGHTRILFRILAPMLRPAIGATAVLLCIQAWNEYVYANILTSQRANTFPTSVNLFLGINTVAYGEMAAAAVVGTLPVIVLAAIAHKQLIRGLAFGSV